MVTYKDFMAKNTKDSISINEKLLFGIAIERKLKEILNAVQSTDDVGEKINLLMKGLHFSLGGMAYELHKTRK